VSAKQNRNVADIEKAGIVVDFIGGVRSPQ